MKISEVISSLNTFRKQYGDLDVLIGLPATETLVESNNIVSAHSELYNSENELLEEHHYIKFIFY